MPKTTDTLTAAVEARIGEVHNHLGSDGFERVDARIVQHLTTGVMIAANVDGYRITYHCPEARNGSGMLDLPLSAPPGEVAYVAQVLHRAAAAEECVPCLAETAPHTCLDSELALGRTEG